VDVGLEVEDGGEVEQHQRAHEVPVDPQPVTLQRSEADKMYIIVLASIERDIHLSSSKESRKSRGVTV
jgi:hypothetical protein